MAIVREIADGALYATDHDSVVVWPGVTGPRFGTYGTFADRSFDDGAGFSETGWQSAIDGAIALADRRGVPTVYVIRNLRTMKRWRLEMPKKT